MSDFNTAMAIAGTGMAAERLRMNLVASNLANANTTRTAEGGPYRRRDAVVRAAPLEESFPGVLERLVGENASTVQVESVLLDPSPPRTVFDPDHPDADELGYVRLPNVEVAEEMVNLITATRSYAANATVLESSKQMAARAIDLMR
jgi:flagellar basal-body rod protein FlgC